MMHADLIQQLDFFVPSRNEAKDIEDLYRLTESIEAAGITHQLIPAMFRVFERFPNADLGSPGPLVHAIESCGVKQCMDSLIDSIQRQPSWITIWMARRCLRSHLESTERGKLIKVLRAVIDNPATHSEIRLAIQEAFHPVD